MFTSQKRPINQLGSFEKPRILIMIVKCFYSLIGLSASSSVSNFLFDFSALFCVSILCSAFSPHVYVVIFLGYLGNQSSLGRICSRFQWQSYLGSMQGM
jgi:hypothetical protein